MASDAKSNNISVDVRDAADKRIPYAPAQIAATAKCESSDL